jgi:pimeloyl-ACP methyl ester carboxylesterase
MAAFSSGAFTIAYDDIQPDGAPAGVALLIHGFATSRAENWKRLGWYAAFQSRGFRLIALDLRGHGGSDKPRDPAAYSWDQLVGDVVGLMDHLDLGRVELMGYSMGARIALHTAEAHPGRVANLILGGVGGRLLETGRLTQAGSVTMADAMRADDPRSIEDKRLRGFRIFADHQGEDRLALAAFSEGRGAAPVAPGSLAGLAVPTLVVAGARDEIAGDPQSLADAIPGAKAVSVPGADHFSAIPHALYKAAVFDFLDGWLE